MYKKIYKFIKKYIICSCKKENDNSNTNTSLLNLNNIEIVNNDYNKNVTKYDYEEL